LASLAEHLARKILISAKQSIMLFWIV